MSRAHQRRRNARADAHCDHHHRIHPDHRNHRVSPDREREQIIARLLRAERLISSNAVAATLILDGALADILDVWAEQAGIEARCRERSLDALEMHAPLMAARVRLALMAHEPAARVAHCWAILDSFTTVSLMTTFSVVCP